MDVLIKSIGSVLFTIGIGVTSLFGLHSNTLDNNHIKDQSLGAAIPTVVSLFNTSLASSIGANDTTMSLVSGLTKDGTTLASSTYGLTIDEGTASEEFVIANCTNTSCAQMQRGISSVDGYTSVTALKKVHRRGASVKITDAPTLVTIARILNGIDTFPNKLSYASSPTISAGNDIPNATYVDTQNTLDVHLTGDQTITSGVKTFVVSPIVPVPTTPTQAVNKSYADALAIAGSPDASTITKGIVEEATQAEIEAGTATGGTSARLFMNPSTFLPALRSLLAVSTSTSLTTSLTTVANQRVIVIAKGRVGTGTHVVTLSYNGVVKDQTTVVGGNASDQGSFTLMWSDVPGAATADIVISDGTEIQVIILKI